MHISKMHKKYIFTGKRCIAIGSEADHSVLLMIDGDAVQDLAATPSDSQARFNARSRLPGMAKRLREVRRWPFTSAQPVLKSQCGSPE